MGRDDGAMAQIAAAASSTEDAASGISSPSPRHRYVSWETPRTLCGGCL